MADPCAGPWQPSTSVGSVWSCLGSSVQGLQPVVVGWLAAIPAGRVLSMAARSPRGSPSLVGSQERQIPDTRVVQARRGSLALPGPWEPPGRPSPPAPPGEELKGRPGGRSAAGSCTMPTARSVLILAGLLALWAELPAASAQNVTTKAGVCPDLATEAVNCTVGCQSDGDCESTLKCCPAACGKACQKPDGNAPSCSWPCCSEHDSPSQPIPAHPSWQHRCSRVRRWPRAWEPCLAAAWGPGSVWEPGRLRVCSCWAMLTPSSSQRCRG
ncbi:uncharacterized protein LOC114063055 isoform X1 [Empidonax traillii]|uniref:uncharacterized protein LOC114063055 isoform X1 n=1 Tax=Empidonax traillii TaxID=164674 RepID=UPI000FFDB014|nr:uncharacterized protein LOC114063055 isoform X1 [Empidonax traillii]